MRRPNLLFTLPMLALMGCSNAAAPVEAPDLDAVAPGAGAGAGAGEGNASSPPVGPGADDSRPDAPDPASGEANAADGAGTPFGTEDGPVPFNLSPPRDLEDLPPAPEPLAEPEAPAEEPAPPVIDDPEGPGTGRS
ncbi:hypothetical protein [Tautonia sociabilis]|uniref:Lipoprotein n=1 Tax=Tautonia sociabilis TaxID=2080755 RepID=A0A432MRT1_9BACT|nr:hypothetical protein [Tautonia sociabilis]RUL89697.1 hypothetical protein TsocGM_00570 [Tautonia sociabilis]